MRTSMGSSGQSGMNQTPSQLKFTRNVTEFYPGNYNLHVESNNYLVKSSDP